MTLVTAPVRVNRPVRNVPRSGRWTTLACCAALAAATFLQKPGLIAPDTKIDLTQDPLQFLGRALHLWNPQAAFGGTQNQAYGYLFPIGPFFAAGHGLGVPGWALQRAWQSLLLIVAFLGMRALARRMGIGTPATQVLGGLAFALTPMILGRVGSISAEALPECIAPWVLLPLVGPDALERPRRAAALSGLALLCASGVNGSATLALLILPGLWLLMRGLDRPGRALAGWWIVAVVLATTWWAIPLAVMGRYSPPFLQWIESAAATSRSSGVLPTLSGTSDWLNYFEAPFGPPQPGPFTLVSQPAAIVSTTLVATIGTLGLLAKHLPFRRYLLTAVLIGVCLVTFGHGGPGTSMLSAPERSLLDGVLSAFRNTYKFDLVLRIPLALGLAHLVAACRQRQSRPAHLVAVGTSGVCVLAILGASQPIFLGRVEPRGAYAAIPAYWVQTAHWLASHTQQGGHALLLPAAQHPIYTWGQPTDEPLQALMSTPWAVRDIPPLGGAGEALLLDEVDAVVSSGHGSVGLAPYLARAGVQFVVVRNDILPTAQTGAVPTPIAIEAALENSPGIAEAASFGPSVETAQLDRIPASSGVSLPLPSVQVYAVTGSVSGVALEPAATTLSVSGSPGSLLEMEAAGLLSDRTATVMTSTPPAGGVGLSALPTVVTDGYRRQEINMGSTDFNESATLSAGQAWSVDRAGHEFTIGNPAGHQSVAVTIRGDAVRASSSAADIGAAHGFDQTAIPASAFDTDPNTAWESGGRVAVGQWVEEDFAKPESVSAITISVPYRAPAGPPVDAVTVLTSEGATHLRLSGTGPNTYSLPPVETSFLRVTVDQVEGGGSGKEAVLKIALPGVPPVQPALQVPNDTAGGTGPNAFVFAAEPGGNFGCVQPTDPPRAVCAVRLGQITEDRDGLSRVFTVKAPTTYGLSISAVAGNGVALEKFLPTAGGIQVASSSQLTQEAADSATTLVEGGGPRGWIAAPSDRDPTLTVTLPTTLQVTGLVLRRDPNLPAASPSTVDVTAGPTTTSVPIGPGGQVRLPVPIRVASFQLAFPSGRPGPGRPANLPVGLSELRVLAAGLDQSPPAPNSRFVVPCGEGPTLQLDGTTIPTEVTGTVAAALSDGPLTVHTCAPFGPTFRLASGRHTLVLGGTAVATPDAATLTAVDTAIPNGQSIPAIRDLRVGAWAADHRSVTVGPGAASWLVIRENFNQGWVATLHGHRLTAAVIDGWQQAFLVPAGPGGQIRLRYGPDTTFRLGLGLGALAALLLIPILLIPARRRRRNPPGDWRGQSGYRLGVTAAVVAVPLVGGAAGAATLAGVGILSYIVWRWSGRNRRPVRFSLGLVAAATLVAGAVLAAAHHTQSDLVAATGPAAQVLALTAMSVLAVTLLGSIAADRPRRSRRMSTSRTPSA